MDVAPLTALKAKALGDAGQQWLASLPRLVADLEQEWQIEVGDSIGRGSASYVAAARTRAGDAVVLKLAMPDGLTGHGEFARELRAVELGQGRGYVTLLRSDAARRALLMERLGQPLAETGRTIEEQLAVIAELLAHASRPDAGAPPWRTGADQAAALETDVRTDWETCGRPCPERVIARAQQCARARHDAFEPASAVIIHGDAHSWNVLEDAGGGFKAIDPDAMLSHPAHDLAIPIRHWNDELLADDDPARRVREWCALLSSRSGADDQDIWEWAFLERVSTGLFVLRLGDPSGASFLQVAELLADS